MEPDLESEAVAPNPVKSSYFFTSYFICEWCGE